MPPYADFTLPQNFSPDFTKVLVGGGISSGSADTFQLFDVELGQVSCIIPGPNPKDIKIGRSLTLDQNGHPMLCGYDEDRRFVKFMFYIYIFPK